MHRDLDLGDPDATARHCARLWGATSDFPFRRLPDVRVFRVGPRIFAFESLVDDTISVKQPPDVVDRLVDQYPAIRRAYHLNKRHWVSVPLDSAGVDESMRRELVEVSYHLIIDRLSTAQLNAVIVAHGTRTAHLRRSSNAPPCDIPSPVTHFPVTHFPATHRRNDRKGTDR